MEGFTEPEMLKDRAFFKLGEFCYDNRKKVFVTGILVCITLSSLMLMGPNWAEAWGEGEMESVEVRELFAEAATNRNETITQNFKYLVYHPTLTDGDELWRATVIESLKEFATHDNVLIEYSWEANDNNRDKVIHAEDGFWAVNVVKMNMSRTDAKILYSDLKETVSVDGEFEDWRTGNIAVDHVFDQRIADDLIEAELISVPLSLIILGIVFGTLIAALLPIGIGVMTVLAAMGVTIWLSNVTDLTQYAINIITLIGIGVSIDYSLFMVNRFREELELGRDTKTATAVTVATAGKAVFFSGVTVAIGLMGMLFFVNTSLPSLGIGGTLAVSIAMVYSLIVLPSILAMLGNRVNTGRKLPFSYKISTDNTDGIWSKIATTVMKYPWAVLIPTLVILLGAGLPFLQAEFSLTSADGLPPDDEARIGLNHIDDYWPESARNVALVMVDLDGGDPLNETNLRLVHQWMIDRLDDEQVIDVFGYALPQVGMSGDEVVQFWLTPDEDLPEDTRNETLASRAALSYQYISNDLAYIILSLDGPQSGQESLHYIEEIREDRPVLLNELESGESGQLLVGGFAALSLDNVNAIKENLPIALAFILISTSILIFIQVRSVLIPIKAIMMNILSISASFGMLVFVFQWGYGSELLNFTPQPIDVGNPVIMFCIVFGLSMDYEVLMLSRIHEEWERTGDNTLAVANGLQRTGRLITGAAAIMVVVFGAFGLSSVIVLKQIGLGLALAIFIDATIVRALVVPATMRLMGDANWWSPKWLGGSGSNSEK